MNYRQVYSNKLIQLVIAFLVITLTISSAVRAESPDSLSEGFFSGLFDDFEDIIYKIPEIFLKFVLKLTYYIANFSVDLIIKLLTEPAPIHLFKRIWNIILFMHISVFTLMLMFAGFKLMTSGGDVVKTEQAKNSIKNAILLIIFAPLSFLIYYSLIEVSSALTQGILSYVSTDFLYIGEGTLGNLALEVGLGIPFTVTALFTLILLTIRFALVSGGVLFFPIGLTLYFIPATRDYGRLIINFLFLNIFSTFFIALLFATFSLITKTGILANVQILLALGCLFAVNIFLIYTMFFAALKAALNIGQKVMSAVKIASFFA